LHASQFLSIFVLGPYQKSYCLEKKAAYTLEAKFEEMFRQHFTSLVYFARKYLKDMDSSKEVVHKVFITIWENRENFDFDKAQKSYLFTAVYNRCMNYIRDNSKFRSGDVLDNPELMPLESDSSERIEAAELETQIWKTINSLPEKCREIFILNRFEGKKYAEIAEQLEISVKTVETQMSKALVVLRDKLKNYIHLWILILLKEFL
jgi:RNA polymerase sigma-70 factor, ECF subfamily